MDQHDRQDLMPQAGAATAVRTRLAAESRLEGSGRAAFGSTRVRSYGVVREHALLFVIVGLYAAARWLVEPRALPLDPAVAAYVALFFGIFVALGLPIRILAASIRSSRTREAGLRSATRHWAGIARELVTLERTLAAVLAWAAVSVLYAGYLQWKADIGVTVPFSWDERFAAIDRGLHLGADPWTLLKPLFTIPGGTWLIDFVYHKVWGFVILALPGIMAWATPGARRMRFFLVFCTSWIVLGTAGAYLFASAGPVYFAHVTEDTATFQPLLEHLAATHASTPLTSAAAAETLWAALAAEAWPRVGVSAMPSMHLAVATIAALSLWSAGRTARILGLVFLGLMLIGSVLLAWHYAIDGYVSVLVVVVLWRVTGAWLGRTRPTATGSRAAS